MKRSLNAVFILAILFLSSCSGKPGRGNAEKIIKEFYQYPIIEDNTFGSDITVEQYKGIKDLGLVNRLADGYATVTDKGKKYITHDYGGAPDVVTNKLLFNEVTGISFSDDNNADVTYTLTRNSITPFGKLAGYKEGDIVNRTVKITRFDDGWGISKEKYKNNIADYQSLFTDQKN